MAHTLRRRIDHYRVLRSDGKPSFSTSKYVVEGDAERVASKPPIIVSKTLPLIESLRIMNEKKVRSLIIKTAGDKYSGMLLVEDVLNYLGGGELYDIVLNRFEGDINKSLGISIGEIGRINYPSLKSTHKLNEVLNLMISEQIDIAPVLDTEGHPIGIISVHDILRYIKNVRINKRVIDIAIKFVPIIDYSSTLRETMRQMYNSGFRFLFIKNELNQIIGYIDHKEIINYFASGKAMRNTFRMSLEEALLISVGMLAKRDIIVFDENVGVEQALSTMLEKNSGFALIGSLDTPIGILTEYDALLSIIAGD